MKVTNLEAINYYNSLQSLSEEDKTTQLPVKLAYAVVRNSKLLEPIAIDTVDIRQKILAKYGQPQDDGESYKILPDKIEYVNKEIDSLFEIENDVNLLTFPLDSLGDCELSINSMEALYFMIDNGEG
jgi:hypothetical protein